MAQKKSTANIGRMTSGSYDMAKLAKAKITNNDELKVALKEASNDPVAKQQDNPAKPAKTSSASKAEKSEEKGA